MFKDFLNILEIVVFLLFDWSENFSLSPAQKGDEKESSSTGKRK